jgi:hypothetical protein
MTGERLFLSYSGVDGAEFSLQLADALEAAPPYYRVWMYKRDLRPGRDWDEQVEEAIRSCGWLLFVMTKDSVRADSVCKQEWTRALKYRKPVIPLLVDTEAEMPFRLGSRQYISFGDTTSGTAQLRQHLAWTTSPEGILAELKIRMAEASWELFRTAEHRRSALEAEILELGQQIDEQQRRLIGNSIAEPVINQDGGLASVMLDRRPVGPRKADDDVKPVSSGFDRGQQMSSSAYEPTISASDISERQLEVFGLPNKVGLDAYRLGAELVAGSIVVDSAICGYEGVDLSSVVVTGVGRLEDLDSHPAFILADKRSSSAPVPNRPKAHLAEWHAPVIDQGDIVTLDLARSDYWTSEATRRSIPRIQREVIDGHLDLMRMPRRLDVHLVVICEGDGMLLLARRGSHVATEPSTWMVSVGESMDWEQDKSHTGVPHPALTATRCLTERDELNLPREIADSASFRLVAMATEWAEMLANLIVVTRIPEVTFDDIWRYFRKGENSQLDAISFNPRSCGTLLKSYSYAGPSGRGVGQPISDISRVALLAALRATYPLDEIMRDA